MLSQMLRSHLLWLSGITRCVCVDTACVHVWISLYVTPSVCSSIHWWHAGCPRTSTIVNKCCSEHRGACHLFKWFLDSLDKYPEAEQLGHMVFLCVTFLSNLHSLFHSGGTNSQFHQQYMRVSFSLHPHQHLPLLFFFLIITIMAGVVLICSSLIISNIEHLFLCLLAIYMSSLEKYLFSSSTHFLIVFCCY